jgi:hypothetical protein
MLDTCWQQVVQKLEPLRVEFGGHQADAGRVTAGPVERLDKPRFDRIAAGGEYNRDLRRCRFGGTHRRLATGRHDDGSG